MKKTIYFLLFLFFVLSVITVSGLARGFYQYREKAEIKCDEIDGEVIFFGRVRELQSSRLNYESICMTFEKSEEEIITKDGFAITIKTHFTYFLLE